MEFLDLIRQRYSVRKFEERPVGADIIKIILEAAREAPTAVNKQPQRILLIQSPSDMEKLSRCTKYTFGAPYAFIVCTDESQAWERPDDKENSGIIDASIVATYIMLAIANLNLGTCWVGRFNPHAIKENFNLPENVRPVAIFPFGYPAKDSAPSEKHNFRLPLTDFVKYGSF